MPLARAGNNFPSKLRGDGRFWIVLANGQQPHREQLARVTEIAEAALIGFSALEQITNHLLRPVHFGHGHRQQSASAAGQLIAQRKHSLVTRRLRLAKQRQRV